MIKIGICGYGRAVEEYHLPSIKKSAKGFKIISVFDIIPDRLRIARIETGAKTSSDYSEFLKSNPDLVIIATPSNSHKEYALKTIEAGIGVIIEKPMALSVKDCDEIIIRAAEKGVFLTVHHNRRWDGDFLSVKKALQDKPLGRIDFLSSCFMGYGPLLDYSVPEFDSGWRYKKGSGGGQLFDIGSHLIDQLLDLMQDEPIIAGCEIKKELWSKETDTYFKLNLEFRHTTRAIIIGSQISKDVLPRWEIRGEHGYLTCVTGNGPLELGVRGEATMINVEENQHQKFYENVYEASTKREDPIVTPEQALKTVAIIEKAYKIALGPIV